MQRYCQEISAELGIEVGVDYRPVTTHNRFLLLVSGGIDLECGSSSITSERKKQSAFSPVIFVTGTKLLVKRDSPVTNLRDLRNKTVVLTRDTSNADAIERLSQNNGSESRSFLVKTTTNHLTFLLLARRTRLPMMMCYSTVGSPTPR